ncbi:MAG TPA: MotA/TolQ/ExbB proton channel family protein [Kofleriaceae bacterium]|nr:MotA/TolQ/ExbB proton channel family protein [Kofleriaceae bacterium]
MQEFFLGWGFTAAKVGLISLVFLLGLIHLSRELRYIRELTDYLGYDLVASQSQDHAVRRKLPPASLRLDEIRDQVNAVVEASDPVWALKQVRGWQMRAGRLESALAFWVDLLRQLGLLGTVIGLGLAMLIERTDVSRMLGPLGLAVWTTVAGLAYSIWLSMLFGMKVASWADACEKNIEAWEGRRRPVREERP